MDFMNINYAETRLRGQRRVMTSCEEVHRNEFSKMISSSVELHKFLNMLALDIKIIEHKVGLQRVIRMLGIFHNPFSDLASRILNLDLLDNYRFCNITYPLGLIVQPPDDENDCVLLQVITRADEDDEFRDKLLSLVACNTHSLSMDDVGISFIKHVLNLKFTRKTTQEDVLLHALMAEFDEVRIFDGAELPRLASKLTSDPDLFVKFFKTRRGSLMLQILLGKSVEFDTMLFEAFKQRFTDVTTHIYGYDIVWQIIKVFSERGNHKAYHEIGRLMGEHALHLAKDPYHGHIILKKVIDDIRNLDRTIYIACVLEGHYIELSFLKHGSSVVETLLDEVGELPLNIIFMEIVKCDDEDRLVRLAKDEYGNVVLKKTLELTKALGFDYLLVDKLMPILDSLLGTRGENIVALINVDVYKKVESGGSDIECPICLAEYASINDQTIVSLLECKHCFHMGCISKWLKWHSSCPICRREVSLG